MHHFSCESSKSYAKLLKICFCSPAKTTISAVAGIVVFVYGNREKGLAQRSKKSRINAYASENFFGYRKRAYNDLSLNKTKYL